MGEKNVCVVFVMSTTTFVRFRWLQDAELPNWLETTMCAYTPKGSLGSAFVTSIGFHMFANRMLSSEKFAMPVVCLEVAQHQHKIRCPFRYDTDKHLSNLVGSRRAMGRSTAIRDYQNQHYTHELPIVRNPHQAGVLTGSTQPDPRRQQKIVVL